MVRRVNDGPCLIEGCVKPAAVKGWCEMHYARYRRHGDPLVRKFDSYVRPPRGRVVGDKRYCSPCALYKHQDEFHESSKYKCKKCTSADQKKYRASHPDRMLASHLKTMYNITTDDYDRMLASQGGVCAICGLGNANGRRLSVDHDHACCDGERSCGKCVRGLLCDGCNRGLGSMRDSLVLLGRAAKYLERN